MVTLTKFFTTTAFSTLTLCLSASALACPKNLRDVQTKYLQKYNLCSIHDRYQHALSRLRIEKDTAHPERVENIRAPRFINLPDWTNRKSDLGTPNALYVYNPAPLTWLMWDAGAQIVDDAAVKNFAAKNIQSLSIEWLKMVHGASLTGLIPSAGKFRSADEFGLMINHLTSLSEIQVANIASVEYVMASDSSKKLVSFTPIECLEEAPREFLHAFLKEDHNTRTFDISGWPHDAPSFFKTETGEIKRCGYFMYAPVEEIAPQLEKWLEFVNGSIQIWNHGYALGDPIFTAARAERWFVSIHPYVHGNGRMSRFVMDWILESLGLPAPIIKDQNEDLFLTETQWAQEVGDGLLRTLNQAELCADQPSMSGCDVIPLPQDLARATKLVEAGVTP